MWTTLYALFIAWLGVQSVGSYEEDRWPVALVLLISIALPGWLDYRKDAEITGRRVGRVALAAIGMSLFVYNVLRQYRAFRFDPGYPQPRWRLGLLDPSTVTLASVGIVMVAASTAIWLRPELLRQTFRGTTPAL